MDLAVVVSLVAFVALAGVFVFVLRRASGVFAETRRAAAFRSAVSDAAGQAAAALATIADRADGVRRGRLPAATIAPALEVAAASLAQCSTDVRALETPVAMAPLRAALLDELGRGARAVSMVEHGCAILASAVRGGRELEAHTAIKRGYLNLLHSREALERHASAVAAWRTAGETNVLFGRREHRI